MEQPLSQFGAESRRPTLYGSRQAISAGHYLAAAAGYAVLEAGGNAVDAGCCAGMALAVLHADEVNFAGVAPIMYRPAGGEVVTIAGLGHWPAALDPTLFVREHGGTLPRGVLRTVVPAAPDAWITALRDHGTMTFGDVAAGPIRLARDGFAVFTYLADEIAAAAEACQRWPSTAAVFMPGGRVPGWGSGSSSATWRTRSSTWPTSRRPRRATAAPGWRRPARPSTRATSRRGSSTSTGSRAGSSPATTWPRSAHATSRRCASAGATSRCSPAGRGARARCWPRRC